MTLTVNAAADLDPALICEIADGSGQAAAAPTAWQPASGGSASGQASGAAVRLAPALLGEVQRRCEQGRAVLRGGEPVYGVTTGMGALAGVRLTGPQQLVHQRNLLLARASGGPPWLAAADVRALFAVRLRTFLSGDAGVSGALCQRLADFLNEGIVPAVPCTGAGSAGEIIPLAHAFGPLAGIGQVLGTGDEARPAAGALAEHGLDEFALGPKEGIALLAGVPGATALAIRRAADARRATAMMEAAAGLSIAAAGAPRDPYVAACARGDDILAGVLARLRAFIGDGRHGEGKPSGTKHSGSGQSGSGHGAGRSAGGVQAPVSFRVAGPVLTQVLRAHGALTAATGRLIASVLSRA
jgi:histidine ammonia-lyase